jgi:Ca2+-binding RTX toxin-like protein
VTPFVLLDGGAAEDLILGNADIDFLSGAEGADVIAGGGSDDNILGDWSVIANTSWSATRVVTTANGVNTYTLEMTNIFLDTAVDSGDDEIYGGMGDGWIFAGVGDDYVDGGGDNDVIFGLEGYDVLFGGAGNDLIVGDHGGMPEAEQVDDYLDSEDGNDTLWGGAILLKRRRAKSALRIRTAGFAIPIRSARRNYRVTKSRAAVH